MGYWLNLATGLHIGRITAYLLARNGKTDGNLKRRPFCMIPFTLEHSLGDYDIKTFDFMQIFGSIEYILFR
jgi:hypothetical protein